MHGTKLKGGAIAWRIALGAGALAAGTLGAQAQSASVARELVGRWSGSGTLTRDSGTVERIRCSASYAASGADSLQQHLNCRSDSTQFNLVSNIAISGGQFRGDWVETNRNARGDISGTLRPGLVVGAVIGPGFSASVAIAVRGRRQTVEIRSNSGDIRDLHMALAKS